MPLPDSMIRADVLPLHLRTFIRTVVTLSVLCALLAHGRAEAATVTGDLKIFVLNVGQARRDSDCLPARNASDAGRRRRAQLSRQPRRVQGADAGADGHRSHARSRRVVSPARGSCRRPRMGAHHVQGEEAHRQRLPLHELVFGSDRRHQRPGGGPDAPARQGEGFSAEPRREILHGDERQGRAPDPAGYGASASNKNNLSVVVLVSYNTQKFLFTGDAEKKEEKPLLDDPATAARLQNVTLYKVGHHGAETRPPIRFSPSSSRRWRRCRAAARTSRSTRDIDIPAPRRSTRSTRSFRERDWICGLFRPASRPSPSGPPPDPSRCLRDVCRRHGRDRRRRHRYPETVPDDHRRAAGVLEQLGQRTSHER